MDELLTVEIEEPPTQVLRKRVEPPTAVSVADRVDDCADDAVPVTDPGWTPAPGFDEAPLDNGSLIGRRLLGYQVLAKLGAGGMGAVYQARHLWLDKLVAIKVLPKQFLQDAEAIARFRREARAVGRLDHPNVVRANDAGEFEGVHFLVTEHVDGVDLSKLLKGQPPLKVADACEIVRQAAWGLQYAHEQGLVHRDIKPSNIMLARGGCVKVLDFGLARLEGSQTALTSSGCLMGTFDFMAPEQAGDIRRVDIRGDIYSLGCTLYFLLTGHAPFGGEDFSTPASKIKAHLSVEPAPIAQWRRKVPAAVIDCVTKMMAKQPGERYATPAEVALALTPLAGNANVKVLLPGEIPNPRHVEPPPDYRPSPWRWVRHWLAVAGNTALLPFRLLAWFGRSLVGSAGSNGKPDKSSPFSLSGVLLFLALAAAIWFSGISCVPLEHPAGGQTKSPMFYFGGRQPPKSERSVRSNPPRSEGRFDFYFGSQ